MPEVKERPILFSAPMVRAILEGRKTVTRRPVKGGQIPSEDAAGNDGGPRWSAIGQRHPRYGYCVFGETEAECARELAERGVYPYGRPGDRLWVRETWGVISHAWNEHGDMVDWVPDRPATAIRELPFGRGYYSGHVIYAADGPNEWAGDDDGGGEPRSAWHPSIHMPRAACRILLEITAVRVERLQDITPDQAIAEGVDADMCRRYLETSPSRYECKEAEIHGFAGLWQSTGGDWDANPWVWVVEFRRVQP